MRVLKTLFFSLLILLIIGGVGFLVMREVLLLTATSRIKNSLIQMREVDGKQTYLTDCMSRGSARDESGKIHHTQLRFIEDNQYVVEVICNQMEHNPLELERNSLPSAVKPQPGQSGIRWRSDAVLNFTCFDRVASVTVLEGVIATSLKSTEVLGYQGPPSECASYSYQCCDVMTQLGEGELIVEALDCPQTCYETCVERPLILSFTTQPYYNRMTRTLQLSSGQTVVFSYLVTPNQNPDMSLIGYGDSDDVIENFIMMIDSVVSRQPTNEEVRAIMDYGDGTVEEFIGMRGQAEHTYHCAGHSCEYNAKLKVVNAEGVESLDTAQNNIKIQVE